MKKKFLVAAASTAMLSGLLIVGSALAENRVETKVTSEPIQSRSTCDKAGGFSMEFDRNTTIQSGDRITIDVDYVSTSNFSALCRDIDIMIAPNDTANLDGVTFAGWDTAAIPASGSPVTQIAVAPGATVDGGVAFHVYGSANTQRITVDVVAGNNDGVENTPSSITVEDAQDSVIAVKFLDQSTNPFANADGIWKDTNSDDDVLTHIYDQAASLADNTLCINVEQWDGATVNANVDSSGDKYTFIPSNPQVAHIVAARGYEVVQCKGAYCGDVPIGGSIIQGNDTCASFDNDGDVGHDSDGFGYCGAPNLHQSNQMIIHSIDGSIPTDEYTLEMEILVNGENGDNGVYFAGGTPGAAGSTTLESACDAETDLTGDATYYNASSAIVTTFGVDPQSRCDVPVANRAVSLTTQASDLTLGINDSYLTLNLPTMIYDAATVHAGANVTIRVKLTRAPCGEIITADHCVGTMVSACSLVPENNTLTYPYFTPADGDGFWDGVAVTNYTNATGSVTLTMYEEDGDIATASVTIAGQSMYVNTLSNMVADGTFTLTTSVEGTLGNARSWIVASSDTLVLDGFGMIANGATGESMGYLPRQQHDQG